MNTAPPPVHEYRVETEDGRLFIWSACDEDMIRRDFAERRYRIKTVQLYSEFLAQEALKEQQQRRIDELKERKAG